MGTKAKNQQEKRKTVAERHAEEALAKKIPRARAVVALLKAAKLVWPDVEALVDNDEIILTSKKGPATGHTGVILPYIAEDSRTLLELILIAEFGITARKP
jgi:hypothetical protein